MIKSCNTGHIFVLKAKLSLAVLTKYRTSVIDETMEKKTDKGNPATATITKE